MNQRIVKLTGKPVSLKLQDILSRLEQDIDVATDEIMETEEMKTAISNIAYSVPTINLQNREDLQKDILKKVLDFKAARIDNDNNIVYDEVVKSSSRLDIVIGLPGSGKSAVIVDELSIRNGSLVLDNDEVKKLIPQYNDGWGADIVHEESKRISDSAFAKLILRNKNIILPKVGGNAESLLRQYIMPAKDMGYNIHVHYVSLSKNKALERMINRYINTGRFIKPDIYDKYIVNNTNLIDKTYEQLKRNENVDSFSKWDNDVLLGQDPILIEQKGGYDYGRRVSTSTMGNNGTSREGRRENDTISDKMERRNGSVIRNPTGRSINESLYDGHSRLHEQDTTGDFGVLEEHMVNQLQDAYRSIIDLNDDMKSLLADSNYMKPSIEWNGMFFDIMQFNMIKKGLEHIPVDEVRLFAKPWFSNSEMSLLYEAHMSGVDIRPICDSNRYCSFVANKIYSFYDGTDLPYPELLFNTKHTAYLLEQEEYIDDIQTIVQNDILLVKNNKEHIRFKYVLWLMPALELHISHITDLSLYYPSLTTDTNTRSSFITKNEIMHVLKLGSGFSKGKNRILEFFQENKDRNKQAAFLSKEYGVGGSSHALFVPGSRIKHDGKGLEINKSGLNIVLTWNSVAKHIGFLIKEHDYLSDSEYETYRNWKNDKDNKLLQRERNENTEAYLENTEKTDATKEAWADDFVAHAANRHEYFDIQEPYAKKTNDQCDIVYKKARSKLQNTDYYIELLDVIAKNALYGFRNIMLIHEQNGKASVVKNRDDWKVFGRKIIANKMYIYADDSYGAGTRFVYDMADTVEIGKGKSLYRTDNRTKFMLADYYGLTQEGAIKKRLISDRVKAIMELTDMSMMDESEIKLAMKSVEYIGEIRCGLAPETDVPDISGLEAERIIAVGETVCAIANQLMEQLDVDLIKAYEGGQSHDRRFEQRITEEQEYADNQRISGIHAGNKWREQNTQSISAGREGVRDSRGRRNDGNSTGGAVPGGSLGADERGRTAAGMGRLRPALHENNRSGITGGSAPSILVGVGGLDESGAPTFSSVLQVSENELLSGNDTNGLSEASGGEGGIHAVFDISGDGISKDHSVEGYTETGSTKESDSSNGERDNAIRGNQPNTLVGIDWNSNEKLQAFLYTDAWKDTADLIYLQYITQNIDIEKEDKIRFLQMFFSKEVKNMVFYLEDRAIDYSFENNCIKFHLLHTKILLDDTLSVTYEQFFDEIVKSEAVKKINKAALSILESNPIRYIIPGVQSIKGDNPGNYGYDIKVFNDRLIGAGDKKRYGFNVDAIRLLKKIENENRYATKEEQDILSMYCGWGGLAGVFDANNQLFEKEYKELKALLTEEEYISARTSVNNAFYTTPELAESISSILVKLGFEKGNILEPSMGTGMFFGNLHETLKTSKLYGVEIDSVSGRIAKILYPDSDISITGYEKTDFPDNFFDAAIGNVPFGDYSVADARYNRHNFKIHDYFFAKTLDKVRPGGLVIFLTSKGTLDKKNNKIRKYISERAELVGAIRLPDNAFKKFAGTEVTTDLLILRKREHLEIMDDGWLHLGYTEDEIPVNEYFVDHPSMILGKMVYASGRFGGADGKYTTCVHDGTADTIAQLKEIIDTAFTEHLYQKVESAEYTKKTVPADPSVRNYTYTILNDTVYFRKNSIMEKESEKKEFVDRVRGLIEINQLARQIIDIQLAGCSDAALAENQKKLTETYEAFVKCYGSIRSSANKKVFEKDDNYPFLCSLEDVDEKNHVTKAAIFTRRTIDQKRVITKTDTAVDALKICICEKGFVDIPFMLSLLNVSFLGMFFPILFLFAILQCIQIILSLLPRRQKIKFLKKLFRYY